jgi:hypothetical protein
MKNLKILFVIINITFYSSSNAQEKETQEVFATLEISDARNNGNDITPEALESDAKLIFYKSNDGKEILLSNYWAKSDTQSWGRIYTIEKEEFPETEKELKHCLYQFQWSYNNSYDDKMGTAKIKLLIIYKPQGIYFECTVMPENLDVLVYKGRMEGDLAALESSVKK